MTDLAGPPQGTAPDSQALIACAHKMADAARLATLRHFRSDGLTAETKADTHFDPVTAADRDSEAAMRAVLAELRPDDAILGEEEEAQPGTTGLTWVLDPIDGTRGFLIGTPVWGVLIGLRNADRLLYGLIDQPYIGERFEGGFGISRMTGPQGSRPLRTSQRTELSEARLLSTFPEVGSEDERTAFHRLAPQVRLVRYGLDCYGYALLATGGADLVVEAGLHSYDVAGPIAVVEAAGGVVTDWKGGSAIEGGRLVAAANADLHRAALDVLGAAGG